MEHHDSAGHQGQIFGHAEKRRETSTAYLNGLRGLAALFVYHWHLILPFSKSIHDPYYGDSAVTIFQLPVLRIIYAGPPMVWIFFSLSGYVLSLKLLRLSQQGQWTSFSKSLTSSIFRRGFRLILPCLPSTFVFMLATHIGIAKNDQVSGDLTAHQKSNIVFQVEDWLVWLFRDSFNFWRWDQPTPFQSYGPHLWTVGAEYRDSLMLFTILAGLSRRSFRTFVISDTFLTLYCLVQGKRDLALFLIGALLARFSVRTSLHGQPPDTIEQWRQTLQKFCYTCIFVVGVYAASLPCCYYGKQTFRLRLLTGTPWSEVLGASLIFLSVLQLSYLQQFFATSPLQFLGRVSFSLYIVHEPILRIFGWPAIVSLRKRLYGPTTGEAEYWSVVIIVWVFLTPPVLVISHWYSVYVDQGAVKFSKWLDHRLLIDEFGSLGTRDNALEEG